MTKNVRRALEEKSRLYDIYKNEIWKGLRELCSETERLYKKPQTQQQHCLRLPELTKREDCSEGDEKQCRISKYLSDVKINKELAPELLTEPVHEKT